MKKEDKVLKYEKLMKFRIPLPKQRCQAFVDRTKYKRKDKFKGAHEAPSSYSGVACSPYPYANLISIRKSQ